jgi:hypothetical protein
MVKVVREWRQDGFPGIHWEQEVPTGQSLHTVQQSIELKITAVVMVFVFAAVYAASEQVLAAGLAALFIGGMCLGGDKAFKGGLKVWDQTIAGPEPREGAAEAERRARATAVVETQACEAIVLPHGQTKQLYFWVYRGRKGEERKCVAGVPLESVPSFEIGTFDEWFGGIADAELRRMNSAANSYVIVTSAVGEGVVLVAESAGAKGPIAYLHGLLTKRFVMEAPEMLARWKEKLEEEERRKRAAEAPQPEGA